jgi:hypothetical protein
MTESRQKLLIVEGPAGSGKTHFLAKLNLECTRLKVVQTSLWKRQFSKEDIPDLIVSSSLNDYIKILEALDHHTSAIDRCVVSEWVYGTLRRSRGHWEQGREAPRFALRHLDLLVQTAATELLWRGQVEGLRNGYYPEPPQVFLMVYTPPVYVVHFRRKQAGKEYPWTVLEETLLYRDFASQAADELKGSPLGERIKLIHMEESKIPVPFIADLLEQPEGSENAVLP